MTWQQPCSCVSPSSICWSWPLTLRSFWALCLRSLQWLQCEARTGGIQCSTGTAVQIFATSLKHHHIYHILTHIKNLCHLQTKMACWKLAQLWGFKHEEQKFNTTKLKFKNETIKNWELTIMFFAVQHQESRFHHQNVGFHHQTFGISAPGGYHGYHSFYSWKPKRCAWRLAFHRPVSGSASDSGPSCFAAKTPDRTKAGGDETGLWLVAGGCLVARQASRSQNIICHSAPYWFTKESDTWVLHKMDMTSSERDAWDGRDPVGPNIGMRQYLSCMSIGGQTWFNSYFSLQQGNRFLTHSLIFTQQGSPRL